MPQVIKEFLYKKLCFLLDKFSNGYKLYDGRVSKKLTGKFRSFKPDFSVDDRVISLLYFGFNQP